VKFSLSGLDVRVILAYEVRNSLVSYVPLREAVHGDLAARAGDQPTCSQYACGVDGEQGRDQVIGFYVRKAN
jgi:hypothetical protein